MDIILGLVLLATFIEGLVTYLFGKDTENVRPWLAYVSLSLGVVAAIAYKIDIPAMAGLVSPFPYVSYVISGLILGRGANYLNDFLSIVKK